MILLPPEAPAIRASHGKYPARWKAVHLAPQVSIILLGWFEQLQMTVRTFNPACVADGLHFGGVQGLKIARDLKILMQHIKRIDAANSHSHRQTHGIAQSRSNNNCALAHQLAAAPPGFSSLAP